jgi:cation:H+ antiporter
MMNGLWMDGGAIAAGLALLYFGAELMVRSSESIGLRLGLSRLVIGLTIVAFSTSAPEIVVSVQAALNGKGDIALGNVFGSNLANIGLILGLSACVSPLAVHLRSIRLDGPIMIATTLLAGWFVWNGAVGRLEGAILLAVLAALIVGRIRLERTEHLEGADAAPPACQWPLPRALAGLAGGLLLLVLGGDWLISGTVSLARHFSVPEAVVAVTIVAIGTSLPELSTSLVAAFRGNADIAVGNVLGSNIFNACAVLGLGAVIQPLHGDGFQLEVLVTTVLGLALIPLLRTGHRIERWEGAVLLLAYAASLVAVSQVH